MTKFHCLVAFHPWDIEQYVYYNCSLTILTGKNGCFTKFSTGMAGVLLLIFLMCLHNQLTLSWRRPLSYRNQSIGLQNKSMDWFLYNNGLRHERVKFYTFHYQYKCLKNVIHQKTVKMDGCSFKQVLRQNLGQFLSSGNTYADLKISLYVCVHIKTIPWKFRIHIPKNSWVICPWNLQIS